MNEFKQTTESKNVFFSKFLPCLLALIAITGFVVSMVFETPKTVEESTVTEVVEELTVIEKCAQACYKLKSSSDGDTSTGRGNASAVCVGENLYLTCWHCLDHTSKGSTVSLIDNDGFAFDVKKLLYKDEENDIALMYAIPKCECEPIPIGDSDSLQPGDLVYTISSPETFKNQTSEGVFIGKDPYYGRYVSTCDS